jgi:hypothetical protein
MPDLKIVLVLRETEVKVASFTSELCLHCLLMNYFTIIANAWLA